MYRFVRGSFKKIYVRSSKKSLIVIKNAFINAEIFVLRKKKSRKIRYKSIAPIN